MTNNNYYDNPMTDYHLTNLAKTFVETVYNLFHP